MANTCRMSLIRWLYWWQCSHLTAPTIPNRNSCALDALPRQGAARRRLSTKSNYRRGGKKERVVRKKVVSSYCWCNIVLSLRTKSMSEIAVQESAAAASRETATIQLLDFVCSGGNRVNAIAPGIVGTPCTSLKTMNR